MNDRDRFDKFTEHGRRVLSLAQEEAERFQHNYVGTEHLLLGLVREGEGVAVKVLANLGIELTKVRSAVEFIMGRGDRIVLGEIGLTPPAKKVIELAVDEARRFNHHYIGTEHLLLGLVREGEGIAAGVLEALGVNLEKVRTQTIRVLSQTGNSPESVSPTVVNMLPAEVSSSHRAQLYTLPFSHVALTTFPLDRVATWLRGAAAAGWSLPLGLAHDLGLLLCWPTTDLSLRRPDYLPFDDDTSPYLAFLQRVAASPLVRELPHWQPAPSDTVLAVLLARLLEDVDLPGLYRPPSGPAGAIFLRILQLCLAQTSLAQLWQQSSPTLRPNWSSLLPVAALTRIETNLAAIDPREVSFLVRYGAPLLGSPDPREVFDLLNLTTLPPPARLALSQVLTLLPQVSESRSSGGQQAYPEGGYEGLTPKGTLDSLLPGELAYPEDIFLHRLHNHEALYYGRERPREQRRELVYLVGQLGWGLGGDGQVLVRALLLALSQTMRQRGYEVWYSFAGMSLSEPRLLEKVGEVGRVLYAQESGRSQEAEVLRQVQQQLIGWRGAYHRRQVIWVLSEYFDADGGEQHAMLYRALQMEAEQQVWYVRQSPCHRSMGSVLPPVTARYFKDWHIVETQHVWKV